MADGLAIFGLLQQILQLLTNIFRVFGINLPLFG